MTDRSPTFPRDGLCPTCHEPFNSMEVSAVGSSTGMNMSERVVPPTVADPVFIPCGHDASACFR